MTDTKKTGIAKPTEQRGIVTDTITQLADTATIATAITAIIQNNKK